MALKVAVLDDYPGVSEKYFGTLGDEFEITYFKDTLLPYNHPATPQQAKDDLVQRLEPFQIISMFDSGPRQHRISPSSYQNFPILDMFK